MNAFDPNPPLHLAARYGRAPLVAGLLRYCTIDARDLTGRTALHLAGSGEVARVLLAHGADVQARDALGNTPLHFACSLEVGLALIEAGADVDAVNDLNLTPDLMCQEDLACLIYLVREERAVETEVRSAHRKTHPATV